jgi:signal transduction histidine kinase
MYSKEVLELIESCKWDTTDFLVISENVFDPFIYYSHMVPLVVSLTIGFFVLYKDPRQLLAKILFSIIGLFSIWVFFDLILWATDRPDYTIFFWSIVNLVEPFIFAFSLYFIQVFISGKDTALKNKILIFFPLMPFVFLIPTKFVLLGYDLTNCNREAIEGPLTHYAYFLEYVYILWIVIFSMENFRKARSVVHRQQIFLVTIGIIMFLMSFSLGNIVGSLTDDWRVPQWGIFGMPLFIAFLSYLIVKYKTFDIKLISTQALAVTISLLVGSQFFFIHSAGNRVLNGITLLITIVAGFLLVRSVKREIKIRETVEIQKEEMKVINIKLKGANDRLKELDKQKTEFVSFASHQLRSPLTAIKGYSSLMLDGDYGPISDDLKKAAQIIFESTKTLASVVDDYLNVSRIELGQMKYNLTKFDLAELVKISVDELKPNIEKAGLTLEFDRNISGDFSIVGDKEKLQQVFMNTIDNSVKYTPKGKISVAIEKIGSVIRITVKDTGIGIPKDVIPKLFSKFSRASGANKTNIRGTGLGLFIAKEIVTAHKGKIWVESEGEGKGSMFVVEIPTAS